MLQFFFIRIKGRAFNSVIIMFCASAGVFVNEGFVIIRHFFYKKILAGPLLKSVAGEFPEVDLRKEIK